MKKTIITTISIILVMTLLSSCGKVSDIQLPDLPAAEEEIETEDVEPESGVPEAEEPEETVSSENYTVIITKKDYETVFEAPDDSGKTILTFSYSTPVVNIVDNPDASNRINDYLDSVDELYYSGNEKYSGVNYYHELATDNYSYVIGTGTDINTEFYSVRKYTCTRCDSAVISFVYTTYDYLGVSNENYSSECYTFNTADGALLYFADITDDMDALLDSYAEYLKDSDILSGNSLEELVEKNGWYFSREGLGFVAPGSSVITDEENCCVSYECLSENILPTLIPVSCESEASSVSLAGTDAFSESSCSILDMVKIDDAADCSYLVISGTAFDIKISSVEFDDNEAGFLVTDTIWHCSSLSDSAVQLQIAPPTGLPVIMISFSDSSGNTVQYLVAEGETAGTVVLTDEQIVPLG